jgi:UDP:flavonoid glycosyltransferase YjiC (YdhE family)
VSMPSRPLLLISSNGTGMGHLTRLLAMARRASSDVRPQFLSMSRAVPVVAEHGFAWQYVPSRADLAIGPRRWNRQFARRLEAVLARERPEVVVFDGTYPYDGLFTAARWARRRHGLPVRLVWSRRPMWRLGGESDQLSRSSHFDLIVEPGELAGEADRGATTRRGDALRVDPITLLDDDERLDRRAAAAVLGVDPARTTALVTLGAGNVRDHASELRIVVDRLLTVPDLQVIVTRAVIADDAPPLDDRVRATSYYPLASCLGAVDLAFAAAGYNSFHELLGAAVPTAFVPNPAMPLDDQPARARWAAAAGAALCVERPTAGSVDEAVERLVDVRNRSELSARCRALSRPNGAQAAMAAVEQLLADPAAAHR